MIKCIKCGAILSKLGEFSTIPYGIVIGTRYYCILCGSEFIATEPNQIQNLLNRIRKGELYEGHYL